MKQFRRTIGVIVAALIAVVSVANYSPSDAQGNGNKITIGGSQIVLPVVQTAIKAFNAKTPDVSFETGTVTGTDLGFEKLCDGSLDIAIANRPIKDDEISKCGTNNVKFTELLLGYDALVLVANKASSISCLTTDQFKAVLTNKDARSWSVIDPSLGDYLVTGLLTSKATPLAQFTGLVENFVSADGKLRSDVQIVEKFDDLTKRMGTEVTSNALVTLSDFLKFDTTKTKAIQLKNSNVCIDPTVPNIDAARYPAATSLFVYVNSASLDRKPVSNFLNFILSSDNRNFVTDAGFVAASNILYDRDVAYLTSKPNGRTFSRIQLVNVPADQAGTINVDGSPLLNGIFRDVVTNFTPRYAKIKVANVAYGNDAGYRKLCANTVDVIGVTRPATDGENQACATAKVDKLTLNLGSQGVVVLVNSKNSAAQCLKSDQLGKIFNSDSTAKKWSDVSADLGAADLLVLVPTTGAVETDLLLTPLAKDKIAPVLRKTVTENADPLYRATAVQNVEGGITYLTTADYKKVQDAKINVKAAALDFGKGCVAPTDDNIKNGSYPYSQTFYLVFNVASLGKAEVKAFVWYLLSDDALTVINKQGLLGTDTNAIGTTRDAVLEKFAQQPTIQATAAATAQVLQPLPTVGATLAATTAATTAPTVAATTAATLAATPAATAAATQSK